MWQVTLYATDGWVDTGIRLKKGDSVWVSPASTNGIGFYENVTMKLNGSETQCRGRQPVKFDQTLMLRYHGAEDFGLIRDYKVADVGIKPWEF